jgi:hypothetical protein
MGAVAILLPASSIAATANSDLDIASRQCATLRSEVLWHVGDRARELLFASQDMDRNGWLNPGVANDGFKAVQLAVMHFDFAYEDVAMGDKANTEDCDRLTGQFRQVVDSYLNTVLLSGKIPQ